MIHVEATRAVTAATRAKGNKEATRAIMIHVEATRAIILA
eukprot:CAMPEP_0119302880 /NCGR_PEP_ID=MMETSP1333-20130426/4396_1 /TAXON_ID=418940 /ORGANISM="Scyphosphaera apsteinii, Strain RCC1455" /LENGTH=39 /DNA_ID= /DNA_START= /DNA_END= /DNA_ORIENTATION=